MWRLVVVYPGRATPLRKRFGTYNDVILWLGRDTRPDPVSVTITREP